MKQILILIFFIGVASAAGLLQNEDFKTEAELVTAGGTKAQLLNDTKVYVTGNSINKTLDDAIVDGDIGAGFELATKGTLHGSDGTTPDVAVGPCANNEILVWDSGETDGTRCATVYEPEQASDTDDFPSVAAGTLITGQTTNPTYGGTIIVNKATNQRVGNVNRVVWNFRQSSSGTAGSGSYRLNLPAGYEIDTSVHPAFTPIGDIQGEFAGAYSFVGIAQVVNSTSVEFIIQRDNAAGTDNGQGFWGSSQMSFTGNPLKVRVTLEYHVSGWTTGITAEQLSVTGEGNAGESITANTTPIPFIEISDTTGSWDGDEFTPATDGRYHFDGSVASTASLSADIDLYLNNSFKRRIYRATGSGLNRTFSVVLDLVDTDEVEFRTDTGMTLSNNPAQHYLEITKFR